MKVDGEEGWGDDLANGRRRLVVKNLSNWE